MSNRNECVKRKYKTPIFNTCLEVGLNVDKSMTIEKLCEMYHNYMDKGKKDMLGKSEEKVKIKQKSIKKENYKKYTSKNLLKMCRDRGMRLLSSSKSYLIERLEKDDKEKSKQKSDENEMSEKESKEIKEEYIKKSVDELKLLCRERKIPLKSYKKDFLIEKLQNYDKERRSNDKSITKKNEDLRSEKVLGKSTSKTMVEKDQVILKKVEEKGDLTSKKREGNLIQRKGTEQKRGTSKGEDENVENLFLLKRYDEVAEYIKKCYM